MKKGNNSLNKKVKEVLFGVYSLHKNLKYF